MRHVCVDGSQYIESCLISLLLNQYWVFFLQDNVLSIHKQRNFVWEMFGIVVTLSDLAAS
jgi:hypothetical protein